jgi:hypothetical protein
MTPTLAPAFALVVAAALHLGFQLTVTTLVYPALIRVDADRWSLAHYRHSRGIAPLVVLTYGLLIVTGGWAIATAYDAALLVSVCGGGLSMLTTALVAAPIHNRLAEGPEERLLRRLVRADRVRCLGAVVCLGGALLAS